MRLCLAVCLLLALPAFGIFAQGAAGKPVSPETKAVLLDLARQGWNYRLRTTMVGRDMSIPVTINGRQLSGASLCLVGEPPHPATKETLEAFRALLSRTFDKATTMRYAGVTARLCGTGRSVVLRLYSGHPPNSALTIDLAWLNDVHQLGLPENRRYTVTSPAMAQTFFGRRGQGTHIMVQQPGPLRPGPLESAFFRSILIEELFQSFTFGMDVLIFDRTQPFLSKLQETPLHLDRSPWGSRRFMRALLNSNPNGLCRFDIFMLHAVAASPAAETTDPRFIEFVDAEFDGLMAKAEQTMRDPAIAPILDRECRRQSF